MAFDDFFGKPLDGSPLFEMGNDAANSSPFGENSQFYTNHCGEFSDLVYEGVIDYEKLISFLLNSDNKLFNWKEYISTQIEEGWIFNTSINIPFEYAEYNTKKLANFEQVKLNKRICHLDDVANTKISFQSLIDCSAKKIEFTISFYYANTAQFRTNQEIPTNGQLGDFDIVDKYRAIQLTTSNATIFNGFMNRLDMDAQSYIIEEFNTAYKHLNKDASDEVTYFFMYAPSFVIEQIPKESLWKDLKILLQYNIPKWFFNSSSTLIKVIRGIMVQDAKKDFLYKKFYAAPELIKDIYESLSSDEIPSTNNGKSVPYKSVFATLLSSITYDYYIQNKLSITSTKNFRIDERHKIDSNIYGKDESDTKYNLIQLQKQTAHNQNTFIITGSSSNRSGFHKLHEEQLHPLDLANLTTVMKDGSPITMALPAIMVKDIAYHAEWEEVMEHLRTVGNVTAIVFGAAALLSGGFFVAIIGAADLGLASVDMYIQAHKDEYMQDAEGQVFLDKWDTFLATAGIALAVVSLPELLSSATSLLRGTKAGIKASDATRTFLKHATAKIILEMAITSNPNTTFKSVEIGVEVFKNAPVQITTKALGRLDEKGVVFAKLEQTNGSTSYAAFYKGKQIVPNSSASDFKQAIDPLVGKVGGDLVKALEEIKIQKIVNSGGLRGSNLLRKSEKLEIFNYAKQNYNYDSIKFADDLGTNNTGYMAAFDFLYINTDIMPGTLKTANSRLGWKAAMAHELEGHRAAALANKTFFDPDISDKANELLEEIQASLRSSLHGKDLSKIDRKDLLDDAFERFNSHKEILENSNYKSYTFNELKKILWLEENS